MDISRRVEYIQHSIFPVVTTLESSGLVQVTVVAGPPVEIQVRTNQGVSSLRAECRVKDNLSGIAIDPVKESM